CSRSRSSFSADGSSLTLSLISGMRHVWYSPTSTAGMRLGSFFSIAEPPASNHLVATAAQDNFTGVSHAPCNSKDFFLGRLHFGETHRRFGFEVVAQQFGGAARH